MYRWHKFLTGALTILLESYQKHLSEVIACNEHQARMAVKHGLHRFIFAVANDDEHQQTTCNANSRYRSFEWKILADTIEALMAVIRKDRNNCWECNLTRFMRVFELDYDAAVRYSGR